ncbi:PREDICTED: aspartyl protease AED1-like isoform X1 [Camelina sativa]|uniref:Aspartyl protease AED1-like isoform X1 n=1 Tax=Camelina sativa TaxID=90675 RepID=A0ABM0XVW4_CAMSA|nr:PREDICTED: aspartyl protease AED1-like isoform X1 [Camelina sativa]
MSIMKNFLNVILILCVCLNWCFTEGAEEKESGKVDSYTFQVSSLFPSSSSSCTPSSKASNKKSSLPVVHMHGACSHLSSNKDARLDHDEILRRDQARVKSIHSKLSKNNADGVSMTKSTELPAKDGTTIGSANYIVTIGIGTPKHDVSLTFDTGSGLTWTQCQPCLESCYSQQEPIFNPSTSSSYQNVSCSSPMCGNNSSCNSGTNCRYGIRYADGSVTIGVLAKEKFTLTNSDVLDNIYFGCGENNTGLFNGAAGILGLGRGKRSLPTQTATIYNNIFSYCLPSSASNTGHLTFGSDGISGSAKFTPFTSFPIPSLYGITIVGISVGDKKLEITPTTFSTYGAIIDSGTVITRLPTKVYAELRSVFKEKMSSYKATSGNGYFDTCYDFTGLDTITIPKIAFFFAGGTVVDLPGIGILYPLTRSQVCLAFAGDNEHIPAIFGNVQQKTMEIVYDVAGGRVGFAPNGCS